MTPDVALFFAAGLGSRMGELTRNLPKPLLRVGDITLIDHALHLGQKAGLRRKAVNLHYMADMLRRHLSGKDVIFSDESDALLETGGGLRQALPLLDANPVFTLNTDVAWTGANPFIELAAAWDPKRMEALLLLTSKKNALGYIGNGDFNLDNNGRLTRGPGLIYTGAQILCTDGLQAIPSEKFSLNLLWQDMLERRTLFGLLHKGGWCDVGRPECLPLAREMIGYS